MHTKGEHHVKTGLTLPQAGELPETWKRAYNRFFSHALRGSMPLWAPQSQTLDLQCCETINLLFKPLSLWYFVTGVLGNECS